MPETQSKYPEHEKLRANRDESLILSSFLDWLDQRGLEIVHRSSAGLEPLVREKYRSKHRIIGEFLEIDYDQLNQEKDAMMKELQVSQENSNAT